MIKYVIFDKDGTLLDTESTVFRKSWVMTGEKWGLDGMKENYYPYIVGKSASSAVELLKDMYKGIDAEAFMNERMALAREMLNGDIPLKSGCREILEFLGSHNIKTAVATSTERDISVRNLKKLGLYDSIDALVTGDMVENGKPAPDIFIEAGRRIGADVGETLVVGDSSFDIIGGYRAGMRPVMVIDSLPPNDDAKPLCYAVLNDLFEVIELIKKENSI